MSENKDNQGGFDLLGQTGDSLRGQLVEKRAALRQARFKHALKQLQKTHTLGNMRREIARLQTALAAQSRGTP